ncbi:hypothetical protein LPMP_081030 [Leishmania panamensis]|uniref:Uncharacterized protein n=1 Tax=Leishmania panamensis TaxID=5679 RepID=A0A088S355_LEIPA|nr:hypothetical protein LPMP_081030 [Leishmania panamensis]AIN95911.1 hypothetical protein LPMP_081030 [Leishmania panamensis]
MWRAEENIFARARPARLDTQYSSTSACTTAPPARPLVPLQWFHVPGRGARDAQVPPEGLVASTHLSTSSLLPPRSLSLGHCGAADASAHELGWDGREVDGDHWGIAGSPTVAQQPLPPASHGGAGTRDTCSLGSLLRHPHVRPTHDTSADDTSPAEVSRLLRYYRDENARLREQLKAKELHEAHIMERLEETSRMYAHVQLAWQRATRSDPPSSVLQSADDNVGSVLSVGSGGGKAEEAMQSRLAQKEAEVRELRGRVEAYREALQRSRAHAACSAEERQAAPAPAACSTGNGATVSVPPTSLHVLLLQSLNTADYLVKVFNALQHCHYTRHRGASDSASGCCRRSLHDCRLRCLQAAMKGAPITPELLELEDGPENDTAAANMEAAVAVREELSYCEAVAVRLAASLLGRERFADDDAAPPVSATGAAAPAQKAAPPASPSALEVAGPVGVAQAAAAAPRDDDDGEESAGEGERNAEESGHSAVSCAVAVREPRRRPSRCRPDVGDCEVQ